MAFESTFNNPVPAEVCQAFRDRHAVEVRLNRHNKPGYPWRYRNTYEFFDSDGMRLGTWVPGDNDNWAIGFCNPPARTAFHVRHLMPLVCSWRQHPYGHDGRLDFMHRRALP